MEDIIITIKNVSKQYTAGSNSLKRKDRIVIAALDDFNLEVKRGEILGIIGRNGSGKSTLLKILSKVTRPTSGVLSIDGNVVSAIEVAGGFNPDLTGIDNIRLLCGIWGLSSKQTKDLEPAIIAFSNLEEFIYIPVKKYSTGMIGRLAVSIIIHLEAEVYLFDEALNGSDQLFIQKLHERILTLKKQNKTILFATHKITDLLTLCNQAIVIEKGRLVFLGNPFEAVLCYRRIIQSNVGMKSGLQRYSAGNNIVKFDNISVLTENDRFTISFLVESVQLPINESIIYLIINNSFDLPMGHSFVKLEPVKERKSVSCSFETKVFGDGIFTLSIAALVNDTHWFLFPRVIEFELNASDVRKFAFIPGIQISGAQWEISD